MLCSSKIDIITDDCKTILEKAPVDWSLLKNKRIFLSGGTGFFGKWLLHSFLYLNETLELNSKLTVLSRSPKNFLLKNSYFFGKSCIKFIKGDIRSISSYKEKQDYIIHAATPVNTNQQDNVIYSIILDGTKHIVKYAKRASVKKILYISSGAIYGKQSSESCRIPESSTPHPDSVYAIGKFEAERLLINNAVDTTIARCFSFVGPYLPLDKYYPIGNFINDVINNHPLIIKGDGTPKRSYMYTADLMIWLWTILLNGRTNEIYNVGSEDPISVPDLAKTVIEESGSALNYETHKLPSDNALPTSYIPSTQKAQKELGLKQNYSLSESIKRTIAWTKQY